MGMKIRQPEAFVTAYETGITNFSAAASPVQREPHEDNGTPAVDAVLTLFSAGYKLDQQGDREGAENCYFQAIRLLECGGLRLSAFEQARISFYHATALLHLERKALAGTAFRSSIAYAEESILQNSSSDAVFLMARALGWLCYCERSLQHTVAPTQRMKQASGVAELCDKGIACWRQLRHFASSKEIRSRATRGLSALLYFAAKHFELLEQHDKADAYLSEALMLAKQIRSSRSNPSGSSALPSEAS